ncbi:PEP-CTERM sorting domain-containing protein [Parafrankia sp. BMG5.11]|uniref:PEP-CTERM sorting domain-containing protein n=1 Tax=Parafrankia sp. BMG5.11 TaxID=222540 RepID=UPI00103CE10E|nr:PEP-CTERM sorting domain-containing protein [Parafrankia sp. BMG5.11]TCJ38360.1 PEP-CTERM sorting domain-containing protein [Parafrankia sp. BMG5.11]
MRIAISFVFLVIASPAMAAGTAVPEPSGLALFGLGVLGVIVGRRGARRRRD